MTPSATGQQRKAPSSTHRTPFQGGEAHGARRPPAVERRVVGGRLVSTADAPRKRPAPGAPPARDAAASDDEEFELDLSGPAPPAAAGAGLRTTHAMPRNAAGAAALARLDAEAEAAAEHAAKRRRVAAQAKAASRSPLRRPAIQPPPRPAPTAAVVAATTAGNLRPADPEVIPAVDVAQLEAAAATIAAQPAARAAAAFKTLATVSRNIAANPTQVRRHARCHADRWDGG